MSDDGAPDWPHLSITSAPKEPSNPDFDFTLRLDDGARLSARVTDCGFIVDESTNIGRNWPIATFGEARDGRKPIVTTYNVNGSRLRGGAVEDAELVAWLLTHRGELIRLARIGKQIDDLNVEEVPRG